MEFQEILGGGVLRDKKDGMSELSIVGLKPSISLLKQIHPYLRAKKPLANLVYLIEDKLSKVKNEADFIEVCELVDKIADFTDSRGRKITSELVKTTLRSSATNTDNGGPPERSS